MINSHTELNNQMDIVRRHTVPVITHPHPARVGSGSRTIRLCVEATSQSDEDARDFSVVVVVVVTVWQAQAQIRGK